MPQDGKLTDPLAMPKVSAHGASIPVPDRSSHGLGSGQNQDGPEPLPPCEETVSHRPVDWWGELIFAWNPVFQRPLDPMLPALEVFCQLQFNPLLHPGRRVWEADARRCL